MSEVDISMNNASKSSEYKYVSSYACAVLRERSEVLLHYTVHASAHDMHS